MKLYVLFCLVIGSLYGYAQQEAAPRPLPIESPEMEGYLKRKQPAILTIKVFNKPASAGPIGVGYILAELGTQTRTKRQTAIDKDGTLQIVLEENLPYRQVSLWVDSLLYTIVVVNTQLVIEIDMALTKGKRVSYGGAGVSYSGEDGALNRVLVEKILYRKEERSNLEGYFFDQSIKAGSRRISLDTFLSLSDSVYRQLETMDDALISKHPGYAAIIRNETNSFFYGFLCSPFKTRFLPDSLWQRVKRHQPFFTSQAAATFYSQLSTYVVNKTGNPEQKKQSLLYQHYASYNTEQKAILDSINYYEQLGEPEREKNKQALKALIIKRHTHFAVDEALLVEKLHIAIIDSSYPNTRGDLLKISLMGNLKQYYTLAYPILSNHVQTGWCKRIVDRQLAESSGKQQGTDKLLNASKTTKADQAYIGKYLAPLPFGADLYRLDSVGKVDDLIISLQSTFPGKAILIDFWFTSCVPCLKDMPYSKKLHDDNKDLPIAYVYLCTTNGSNEKDWKKHVEDMKLPGTHIYVDDAIISELKRKFDAKSSFPQYVVIDLEGHANASKIKNMWSMNRNSLMKAVGLP
jgi:thiol-disulfide isomerase/thioredoxin